jgi:hypothetical protein
VVFFGSAMREVRWRWFAAANDYHTAAMFFERSSAASEQAWSEVDGALARIRDTASLAGCQVVAIVFPQHGQLAAGPLERTYQGRLLPILDDLGIAKVDLLPVYRAAAGAGRNPFIPYDGHPNAVGHHLAAEAALASVWTALGNADAPTERP